jgi:hypothetical protein
MRRGCSLTYGEVLPHSVERDVFRGCLLAPLRAAAAAAMAAAAMASPPAPAPCIYDLGSGTGKIPLQLALLAMESGFPGVRGVGVELAADRHEAAVAAFARLRIVTEVDVVAQLERLGWTQGVWALRATAAAAVVAGLRAVAPLVTAVHGDILTHTWPRDAVAVFINNTVFEPALNGPLLNRLAGAPALRAVAVLRSLCARHSGVCASRGDPCCAFGPPAVTITCNPTWDQATTLFGYVKTVGAWLMGRSAGGGAAAASATRLRSPPATPVSERPPPQGEVGEEGAGEGRGEVEGGARAAALVRKRLREGGAPAQAGGAGGALDPRAVSPPSPLRMLVGGVAQPPDTPARPGARAAAAAGGQRFSRTREGGGGGGGGAPSPVSPGLPPPPPAVARSAPGRGGEGESPRSPQPSRRPSAAALLLTPPAARAAVPLVGTPPFSAAGARPGSRQSSPSAAKVPRLSPPRAASAAQ